MSFEKFEWVDRLVAEPNRRRMVDLESGQERQVNIFRDEGNIGKEGTAFSAENMNYLETRISNMFPVSIENGGTSASDSLNALINLGITDSEVKDFSASSLEDWEDQVFNYLDQKLPDRKPFIFNAGYAGGGYGTGISWSTNNTKFLLLYSDTITGAKLFKKNPNDINWLETRIAEGYNTIASGIHSHAEGQNTLASDFASHAEGELTQATGLASHAEGYSCIASGIHSHAEGQSTQATTDNSHAEGYITIVKGNYAHAEGFGTQANGIASHSEGQNTFANGACSHTEGLNTFANGDHSHCGGYNNIANAYQTVIGKTNRETAGPTGDGDRSGDIFIVGGGESSNRMNAMRVSTDGNVYALSNFHSSGAGVSEMFEWADGNINSEDRRGLFVTLEGEKIRIAQPTDNYILGAIDPTPFIVGDSQSEIWKGIYLKDVFGQKLTETVEVPETTDELGNVIPAHTETRYILNPEYNEEEEYISRESRPEFVPITSKGKVVMIDDGTCQVNKYCKVGLNGVATNSEDNYKVRVLKRIDSNHIYVYIDSVFLNN